MTERKQKTIWITGASSGIGAELAKLYGKRSWQVALSARSEDKMKELAAEINDDTGGKAQVFPCDVTHAEEVTKVIDRIESELGAIDLAILNAGTYVPDTAEDFTAENFQLHARVNMEGTANCVVPVLKKMKERKGGHIAIVASVAGFRGLPRSLSYGPSKAGLINFAEALAIEAKDYHIKVQVINPGFVKTPLTEPNKFKMPFLISSQKAASHIEKGLESAKFSIEFPWQMVWMLKTIGLLPARLYFAAVKKATQKQIRQESNSND